MLISVSNGKRPPLISDSMLMQLPVPLRLHQQDAARAAEIGAGEQRHALLLGGQRDRSGAGIGERAVDQDAVAGIGHIGELRDVVPAQEIVELVLPSSRRAVALIHAGILHRV